MKSTRLMRNEEARNRLSSLSRHCGDAIRHALARAKDRLVAEYSEFVGEHERVLRLALNEAEALAWDTEFPHLFFPALAAEKAEAAVSWHRHQLAVRRASGERSFAE